MAGKWIYIYIYGANRFRSVPVSYFTRCMMQMLLCRRISHSMTPVCRSWIQETAWRSPSWQTLRRSPSHHSFNTKSCSKLLGWFGDTPTQETDPRCEKSIQPPKKEGHVGKSLWKSYPYHPCKNHNATFSYTNEWFCWLVLCSKLIMDDLAPQTAAGDQQGDCWTYHSRWASGARAARATRAARAARGLKCATSVAGGAGAAKIRIATLINYAQPYS